MSQNILYEYTIKETIGKGTFSKVKLGINKSTGEKVAIKILEKSKIRTKSDTIRVERELNILRKINHINLVKIYQTKEDQFNIYIIMEFINYDLFLHIVNNKRLDEKESSLYFFQLMQGLEYIHSLNIVHRDLKPENLLITRQRILKIIDFGLSNYFKGGDELLFTPCGSPSYTPPEMIKGYKYNGFAVDIWSTGIILYAMLCGYLPFEERDNKSLFKKIIKCKVVYPKFISQNAQSLLKKILVDNPDKRITLNEIKKHPFYLEGKEIFYRRYPNLVEKIENNSSNPNIKFGKTTNSSITDKSPKDKYGNNYRRDIDKSSSAFDKYNKSKNYGPNFDLLKKILRGSRANSCENNTIEAINKTERNKEGEDKIYLEEHHYFGIENEKNSSPLKIQKLNNDIHLTGKKSNADENNSSSNNFFYKQKFLSSNMDNQIFEDSKVVNNLKNYSSYANTDNIYNQKYNTKRNQKNDFSFINKSKEIYDKGKFYKYHNTVGDEERSTYSIKPELYANNYSFKLKNNLIYNNKNNYSINSINAKNDPSSSYFDSYYDKSFKKSSRIKSYILNNAKNEKKLKEERMNNSMDNRKKKNSNAPQSPKYSGLSKKIISINNLYNSIQNKLDNHRDAKERMNKSDKNENNQNNLKDQLSLENTKKSKFKKGNFKKNKNKFNKSEEHRKKKENKGLKNINTIRFSQSYLQQALKSLKNSGNNSNINIKNMNHINNFTIKKNYNASIQNKKMLLVQKFKKTKKNTRENFNRNNKKAINANDKYNIKEIIKRRGLDKRIK